ncbi:cyanophycinase [Inquilinus sp. KBS0705]|nr:cyanophycinase [Inquilinus sp. KBS0705]
MTTGINRNDKYIVPNGVLVIVGGHEDKGGGPQDNIQQTHHNKEILDAFTKLIKNEDATIEVITTASAEGVESFNEYDQAFKALGVKQIGHIHHDRRADALGDDLSNRIMRADAVYFSGGDQLKLTSIYGGTKLLLNLKERYIYDGLILGGTSAGAMAFSTPMIFAGNKQVQQIAGEVRLTTGLEFLKDVCIDTHFVDRGRFVRMAQVVATNPTCIGIGIEENTAIIVKNGVDAEVIGSGVVVVIEGFKITDSNIVDFGLNKTIAISDLNVHLLSNGGKYQIPRHNLPHI